MSSSAVSQLKELIVGGKVIRVNENELDGQVRAIYDASYQNLAKVMIDPTRPNKNKGEVHSLAYAKATGIPVFATALWLIPGKKKEIFDHEVWPKD